MYCIPHCFICRPLDSTVPTNAGIEARTVATSALEVKRSNHSANRMKSYLKMENHLSCGACSSCRPERKSGRAGRAAGSSSSSPGRRPAPRPWRPGRSGGTATGRGSRLPQPSRFSTRKRILYKGLKNTSDCSFFLSTSIFMDPFEFRLSG